MDAGDLIFYGMIAVSVVASVVKSVKKKQEAAAVHDEDNAGTSTGDGTEWIKNVMRETTKSLFDVDDDDFIPRNPKPTPAANRPASTLNTATERTASQSDEGYRRTNQPAEDFRRTNQSSETFRRPNQSAERFTRQAISLEDKIKAKPTPGSKGKRIVTEGEIAEIVASPALLSVSDDLDELQEVRKALIYGEIMRPKF
ncbi:MAG TPA: hypothetical protein DD409_06960 [Bacteroidales bacterium]|nr:hypothetical protein [Bacteroidales bacterium]